MALVKISELPNASALTGAETFPLNQNGSTKKSALSVYLEIRATPPDPDISPAYLDTSTVPPTLQVWDGASWILGSADLTILQAGMDALESDIDEHIATPHGHPDLATHLAMGLDATD